MVKPLASHKATSTTRITPMVLGEPLGNEGPEPLPPPPLPIPPRRGLRPNMAPRRLLKSRQTSSRSGGPPPWLGLRGGSESLPLPPRPQPGSFRLKIFDIERIASRCLASLYDCPTQSVQAGTLQGAYKYSGNGTMFVTLHPGFIARFVNFVIDKNGGNFVGVDVGQHLANFGNLFVALMTGRVHHMQQQIGMNRLFEGRAKRGNQRWRQVANEAHGIRKNHLARTFNPQLAGRCIERGKQLICCVRVSTGQGIE